MRNSVALQKPVLVIGMLVLVVANILWVAVQNRPTPLVGAVVYAIIAFQVLRRDDYRAAFLVGVVGAGLHLFEFLRGWSKPALFETCLVAVNIVLPVFIACVGFRAWRPR